MNISKVTWSVNRLALAFSIFVGVSLFGWLLPASETWNARLYDFLFTVRSNISFFRPVYDDTIVHVDLNDTSIQRLDTYYFDRTHFARVIDNLSEMGVSAQLHDFIFAAPSSEKEDRELIEAVEKAGNAYFGLAFKLKRSKRENVNLQVNPDVLEHFNGSDWWVEAAENVSGYLEAKDAILTFLPLSQVSRGSGFLNMTPDPDGFYRRVPLLIQFQDRLYPSLPFRLICDYLGVQPHDIVVNPGKSIVLNNVDHPLKDAGKRIDIPIDEQGRLIINYLGPWEAMHHYNFADIWLSSDDRDELEIWQEELQGKIVVVADVTTSSSDVGPVPTDPAYPLGGLNASVIHTILTGSFISEMPKYINLFYSLALITLVLLLSYHHSTITFSLGSLGLVFLFVISSSMLFLYLGLIVDMVNPLIIMAFAFIGFQVIRAIDSARELRQAELEKNLFEKELEIGRQIQADFFPETLPEIDGWAIDAFFKPARQVAGDFYDVFTLGNNRYVAIVVADVCDKGVGAALFMALIRSLIRATSSQVATKIPLEGTQEKQIKQTLSETAQLTSNYIAENHSNTNMFATLFMAMLDPVSGRLHYVNCGHEPPIILHGGMQKEILRPTGPAIGLLPDLDYTTGRIDFGAGDTLFAYTDGVTDAEDSDGEQFGKERLSFILGDDRDTSSSLLGRTSRALEKHIGTANQFDDITMVAIGRTGPSIPAQGTCRVSGERVPGS